MFVIIKLDLLSIDNIYNNKINILEVNISWNNNIFIIVNVYVGLGDYDFNINNIYYILYAIWLKQFKVVAS